MHRQVVETGWFTRISGSFWPTVAVYERPKSVDRVADHSSMWNPPHAVGLVVTKPLPNKHLFGKTPVYKKRPNNWGISP